MKKVRLYLQLSLKLALKGRLSLALLLASVFLLSFIFVVSLSLLLSLQNDQIDVMRDVLDFDLQIGYSDISDEQIRGLEGVGGAYLCSDIMVFSTNSDAVITKRFCQRELFENSRFRSKFDFFPLVPRDAPFCLVSSWMPAVKMESALFITKGRNGRANIYKDDSNPTETYSTPYSLLDNIAFENVFAASMGSGSDDSSTDGDSGIGSGGHSAAGAVKVVCNGEMRRLNSKLKSSDGLFYGIYADDFGSVVRQLEDNGVPFRTYKDISKSVYSALITERVVFFMVLFFLLVVLVILICRLFLRFLAEDARKAAILIVLGMDRNVSFRVFSLPCMALTLLALVSGSVSGCVFVSVDAMKKAVFNFFFNSMSEIPFSVSYPFVALFAFASLALVVAMHFIINARMKRSDLMGIIKSKGE